MYVTEHTTAFLREGALCWGRICCPALGQEPPSFISNFNPHVLGLPTLENVILTVGKDSATLGFLSVSHLYCNNLETNCLLAKHCYIAFPLPARRLCMFSFPENMCTLLVHTGHLFPWDQGDGFMQSYKKSCENQSEHTCAVSMLSFTDVPGAVHLVLHKCPLCVHIWHANWMRVSMLFHAFETWSCRTTLSFFVCLFLIRQSQLLLLLQEPGNTVSSRVHSFSS